MSNIAMSSGNVITQSGESSPEARKETMERFVTALAVSGDMAEAASKAGISASTAYRWTLTPGFAPGLFRERQRRMQTEGAGIGYKVLVELAQAESTPAAVRAMCAKELVAHGGHASALAAAEAAGAGGPAALHELTEDQLARHIAAAGATLAALRSQPVTIDVTPDLVPDEGDATSLL